MKMRKKIVVTFTIIVITLLTIPSVYAFYFSKYESSIISKFTINETAITSNDSYVRATVLTYWIDKSFCEDENDLTTCAISGKSSWEINTSVINTNWTKLSDGYYYYKTSINGDDINNENIKTHSIALINSELSLNELTDEYLSGTNIIPQYEIIYEFIEITGVEEAWNVTYENQIPEKIVN